MAPVDRAEEDDQPADAKRGASSTVSRRKEGGRTLPPPLRAGGIFGGRYRAEELLGRGGMGWVFRGEDQRLRRPVAIKVMRPELVEDPAMAARFEREALAASRLSHPHVVTVHDFGKSEEGLLYLVMEELRGESLADRIERAGALELDAALRVAIHVARALVAAHAAGVVHRDLKPANLFLTQDGPVKVLDFGIARLLEHESLADSSELTAPGVLIGSPIYMSPEAAGRRRVDKPADLYALGITLFEMLTGNPPFDDEEPIFVLGMHLRAAAPTLTSARADLALPVGLQDFLDLLLAKKPEERPTAKETLERLSAFRDAARAQPAGAPAAEVAVQSSEASPRDAEPHLQHEQIGAELAVQEPQDAIAEPTRLDEVQPLAEEPTVIRPTHRTKTVRPIFVAVAAAAVLVMAGLGALALAALSTVERAPPSRTTAHERTERATPRLERAPASSPQVAPVLPEAIQAPPAEPVEVTRERTQRRAPARRRSPAVVVRRLDNQTGARPLRPAAPIGRSLPALAPAERF